MSSIIVALPNEADANRLKEILQRYGLRTSALCGTGSKVLSYANQFDYGVVICGRRMIDMDYTELVEYLPNNFEILLLASASVLSACPPGIMTLAMPFRPNDLAGTIEMILQQQARRYGKSRAVPKKRTEREQNYINNAKMVLMDRNHMTEQDAYRYIQKCSMDSGTNMVETAQMILLMIYDE